MCVPSLPPFAPHRQVLGYPSKSHLAHQIHINTSCLLVLGPQEHGGSHKQDVSCSIPIRIQWAELTAKVRANLESGG